LTPFAKGCGYSLETEADDDNEYIIFENTRLESDSEVDPMKLSAQEFKTLTALESAASSDEEL